jgi:hypothetical protein
MGTPVELGDGSKEPLLDIIDIDYKEIAYIISKITDPKCVLVIEFVVSKINPKNQLNIAQYG